ncbi:hypothetical protein [Paraburkholderia sp. HD33-4]|uniref:hypothetical protein n=1 Tax=Paraburkholderia sp. HD33-4 TaxID=2883242 RepID=UPI001F183D94|nr:hypothetical protein [Paraburkholderia sp. HD33-4]
MFETAHGQPLLPSDAASNRQMQPFAGPVDFDFEPAQTVTRNALTVFGVVRMLHIEAQEARLLLINQPPFARH